VRVTERRSGRSVTVRIVDRGPHVRGRVIDVSKAAARKLGILRRGTARVYHLSGIMDCPFLLAQLPGASCG